MQAAQTPVSTFAGLFNAIISPFKAKMLVVILALILAGSLTAGAQTAPNLENGFKPFGSYDGTHFDTINVMNGNLMVHIPLYSEAPQRGGKLDMQYLLYMTSKNWIEGCSPSPCRWQLLAAGPTLQRSWDVSLQSTMFMDSASGQTVYSSVVNKLVTGDGPAHLLYAIPGAVTANGQVTELETIDGTGYHVSLSNPDPSTGLLDTVLITGRDGTQYIGGSGGGGGCSGRPGAPFIGAGNYSGIIDNFPLENGMNCSKHGATAAMTDGNGNQIVFEPTMSYPAGIDTMGQTLSPWGTAAQTAGDSSGCVGSLPFANAQVYNYPGPNGGTAQVKLCYGNINYASLFSVAGVAETTGTAQLLTAAIRADGSKWVFTYDSNFLNITSITLPTGGMITYGWSSLDLSGNGTGMSRVVTSRTLTDGRGNSSTWTYHWGGIVNGAITNVVTDPLQNDTVHVFTNIGGGGPGWYETSTLMYQGAQANGQLLKRVDTIYGTAALVGGGHLGNVFPTVITTTLGNGKVSQVTKSYDSGLGAGAPIFGNVMVQKEYDWGQGAPGALLRETDTSYQWQVDARYLTAHMLDLPASVTIKDGSGSGCTLAVTEYKYDEGTLQPSGLGTAQQLVSAPNPVRGNLTSTIRWLAPSSACNPKGGTAVTSATSWYNSGLPYRQTDPMGHITTHSYDSAYRGAFSTTTCNHLNQCVSGTYDLNTGLLTSFTNANATTQALGNTPGDSAHTGSYSYDVMGRMTQAQAPPDPANGSAQATNTFSFTAPGVFPLTVTRQKSVTNTLTDVASGLFDGLGRSYRTQHTLPEGVATVDTVFDGAGHVASVSNPYLQTTDETYGVTQTSYDALDRPTQTTKQDLGVSSVAYNVVPVLSIPGDCTQTTDEAGKQRRACADALGRLVEVDETGDNFPGSPATGTIAVTGTLQAGTRATGSVTILGSEQLKPVAGGGGGACDPGTICDGGGGSAGGNIYDTGAVSITVNGHAYSVGFTGSDTGSISTTGTIASGLAAAINADAGASIAATASGATVSLIAKMPGPGGNSNSVTVAWTWDTADFTGPSFTASKSGATLAGGSNTGPTDAGTMTVTLGGFTANVSYGSPGNSTASQVASALVSALSVSASPVTASASGSTVALTNKNIGPAGNIAVSCTSATSQGFAGPSFTCPAGGTLSGGYNPQTQSLDHAFYATLYSYDALGNLLCVEQHGNVAGTGCNSSPANDATSPWRVRRFTYNTLGQLVQAYNPESGQIKYQYDLDGNLWQKESPSPNQTDVNRQTITYCYEPLHRVTGKAYSAQVCTNGLLPAGTAAVSYFYDTGANAIGHLTSVSDSVGGTGSTYAFDILGRLLTETLTLPGSSGAVSKTVSYDYNLDGSLKALHYPSGAVLTYTPDAAGRTVSAVDSGNAINYVTGATYAPFGALTSFVNGNSGTFTGISSGTSYNNRLQPVNMSAYSSITHTAPTLFKFNIDYDFHLGAGDNGNVYGITNDKDSTRNQTFTYDLLNRLISAQNAGTDCTQTILGGNKKFWGNTYNYDAWGNLLAKAVSKCSSETLSVVAGVNNRISTLGYVYDAAGNMTNDGLGNSYTFDLENRITGAAGYTYTYDGDGNRVKKANGTAASSGTLYWYMTPGVVAESDLAGTLKSEYVFFAGERVARRDLVAPAGVFYYLSDYLKTASMITNSTGNIVSESDYYPWGGELQFVSSDSNHYKFTGKERDSESGLDYFGARYYGNALGRFTSADPKRIALRHLLNPQKLNKYSYVLNNPLTLIDPDGLEEFRVFVHFNPGDPTPKNLPNWSKIQENATAHGNKVTVFQGDAANSKNYQSSLSSPGTTVFIGHTQLVDNGAGAKPAAVSLSDKEVGNPGKAGEMGAGRYTDPPAGVIGLLPVAIPAEMPGNVNGGTVALFGCDSTGLAGQYPGAGTFVGVDTTASTDGLLNAGAAFVNSAASGNTVGRAATDANGQINQIPSMDKNAHVVVVRQKEKEK